MRLVLIAAMAFGFGYLALCLFAFIYQDRLIFPAPEVALEPRTDAQVVELSGAGWRSLALHYPAPAGAPTLVHFHGNAEQLADRTPLFERFHALGLGVLAVEYPGYGKATGEPSEESFYAVAEAALGHLRGLGVPASKTVLQGQSIGSGVAAEMAARGHGARLVLLTPYTSMPEMARLVTSLLPGRLLVRHRFDTLAKAERVEVPVLVIHGSDDEVVPFEMAERLSAAFPRAFFHAVEGGTHDLFAGGAHLLASQIFVFATKELPEGRAGRQPP